MSKRSSIDQRFDELIRLRKSGSLTDEAVEAIRTCLKEKASLVVAKAAEVAQALGAKATTSDLVAAFNRFRSDPSTDKGCMALTAIAEALQTFGASEAELYLWGIRHVHMEGAWGGSSDAAAKLRCQCAIGLVRMGYSDVVWELARLMADPDRQCRVAAIRALGHSGAVAGLPLLEYKVLASTIDTDVAAECFGAMVQIDPRKGMDFAATYLDSADSNMAESAALAVGESRRPEAFGILTERLAGGRYDVGLRRTLMMAVGLLRTDQAMDYLVNAVECAPTKAAADALIALALYKKDAKLRDRVAAVVEKRNDGSIRDAFAREFR